MNISGNPAAPPPVSPPMAETQAALQPVAADAAPTSQTRSAGGANVASHRPRYVTKKRSKKKSAAIIGGSAAAGAAIGALAGGGKGAGIGAIAGGASGLIYDRHTAKKRERIDQ
jgi:hypothetical protein